MWCSAIWLSGRPGSARLKVGLDDPRGLFWLKWFCDSKPRAVPEGQVLPSCSRETQTTNPHHLAGWWVPTGHFCSPVWGKVVTETPVLEKAIPSSGYFKVLSVRVGLYPKVNRCFVKITSIRNMTEGCHKKSDKKKSLWRRDRYSVRFLERTGGNERSSPSGVVESSWF